MKPALFAFLVSAALPWSAIAGTSAGSVGCTIINQAAADAVAARIQSDDTTIKDPISVRSLTCLDSFFNGFGVDLVSNFLDPTTLLDKLEGKICSQVNSTLTSLTGAAQCGLTLTGFDLGFGLGSIGGGSFCPKLSFGGGGPSWATLGAGSAASGGGGVYINGHGLPPTGYTLQPSSSAY